MQAQNIMTDEASEILNLGGGKFTFLVGNQRYTLTTPLSEERFTRVVSNIQALVSSFPRNLSQDERLFLSVMLLANKLDEVETRIQSLTDSAAGGTQR